MNNYYASPADLAPSTKARAGDINTIDQSVDAAFDKLPGELALKTGTVNFAANTSNTANAYAIALPLPASYIAYTDGLEVKMRPVSDNTGAATLNVNGLGNVAIKRQDGADAMAGDLVGASIITLTYVAATNSFRMPPLANGQIVQAAASATSAGQSAVAAAQSASQANTSRAAAAQSASDANTSAGQAAASAAAAANTLASKADKASPVFSGSPSLVNAGLSQFSINGNGGAYDLYLGGAGGAFMGYASGAMSVILNATAVPLGIGTNAAQPLLFGTSATERARLSPAGNLLIGTTTDNGTDKLQVNGSARISGNLRLDSGASSWFSFGAATASLSVGVFKSGVTGNAVGYIGTDGGAIVSGGTGANFGIRAEADLLFMAGAAERARITAAGNVLIGTGADNGSNKLQVVGTQIIVAGPTSFRTGVGMHMQLARGSNATQAQGVVFSNGASYDYLIGRPPASDDFTFAADNGAALSEHMRIKAGNGNVLIGTTTDNGVDKLQVAGGIQGSGNLRMVSGTKSGNFGTDVNGPYLEAAGGTDMRHFTGGAERMRLDASGNLLVGVTSGSYHKISKPVAEGSIAVGLTGSVGGMYVYSASSSGGNAAACAVLVDRNTTSGRSINAGGTINASGADYAEYMRKADSCGAIAKGQIVGIDARGLLTDKWADAVSFMVKTTNPSYVGGDTWGSEEALGMAKPVEPQFAAPEYSGSSIDPGEAPAPFAVPVPVPPAAPAGDATDTDIAAYQEAGAQYRAELDSYTLEHNAYMASLSAYHLALARFQRDRAAYQVAIVEARELFDTVTLPAYQAALQGFEDALEAARAKVDRIAFAGQVPCNVWGAAPGMFIVPVQVGDGIGGIAVDDDAITLKQYTKAVGIVQNALPDGRANIRVKVA